MFEKRNELGKFEDNKVAFLNDNYDNRNTQITLYRIFKLFTDVEESKNKDISLFSREEVLEAIGSVPTYSKRTINTIDSTLTNYMAWAVQRGINPTGINPMQGISVKEHLEKNINTNVLAKKFITEEEIKSLRDIVEKNSDAVLNAQDYLCVLLPFYGIYGKNCCEMLNLRKEDINFIDETVIARDDEGNNRIVKVDEFLLEVLQEAINETEYIRVNNWKEALKENGYVLKMPRRAEQMKANGVRVRVMKCLSLLNEARDEQSRITLKSLVASGKYRRIEEIKKEKGKLVDQDFRDVMVEFGDNPSSYFALKEDYYLAVDRAD